MAKKKKIQTVEKTVKKEPPKNAEVITIPYKFKPRWYQLPFFKAMDNGTQRAILVWNRRGGKDKACFNFVVKRACERVGTYFYLLPTFTQAKKVIWDNMDNEGFKMLDHIPPQLIKSTNATELKIELVNGSIIQLMAADEFERSGVGTNPIGIVFSEFSLSNPRAWAFIRPILAANGGWAVFNFTPRGKNHAWELLEQYKNDVMWFVQILTVADTKVLSEESLSAEKREMPQALYNQEYFCEFLEGAGQFFRRVRENVYQLPADLPTDGDFHMGVDLARVNDFSVITPFSLNSFWAYPQDRFNQIDWNLQKARIEASARKHNNAYIKIDGTGVGDPIALDLRAKELNMNDDSIIKFTEVFRMNLLNNLAILLEQDKIKIPNDPILIGELESFRAEITEKGKYRVGCPGHMHDDTVISLALAVWGIPQEPLAIEYENHAPRFRSGEQEVGLYIQDYS